MILMMVINIIFTYPITIFPANQTFETYTIDKVFKRSPNKKYWCKNLSRLIVCFITAYIGIELSNVIDKFLGFVGAVCCAPLAMIFPSVCHLKLLAKNNSEKI